MGLEQSLENNEQIWLCLVLTFSVNILPVCYKGNLSEINGLIQMENSVGPANAKDLKLQRGLGRAHSGINLDGILILHRQFC